MKISFVILIFAVELVFSYADTDTQVGATENTLFELKKCAQTKGIDNTVTCVAMSALNKLQDLSNQENIEIVPGVELSSDVPINQRLAKHLRTLELPLNTEEKMSKIFDMMLSVMSNLFSGRTLRIKVAPDTSKNIMRAFEEGRGKMKKIIGPLMMALGAKLLAVIPIMIGGLALLVTKALLLSKLAIAVAGILGIQYLFSMGGGGNFLGKFGGGQNGWSQGGYGGGFGGGHGGYVPTYGVPGWNSGATSWNNQPSSAYPYARSSDDSHNVVYSGQKQ